MILQPEIGKRIKKARKEAGMTQKDVARDDFTTSFLCQVEKGLINPSLKSLKTIAGRVGKPLIYFFPELESDYPTKTDLILTFAKNLIDLKSYDNAKNELSKALKKAKESKDIFSEAIIKENFGKLLYEKSNYSKAEIKYIEALSIFQELHMPEETANIELQLANLYYKQNKIEKSIQRLKNAEKIVRKAGVIDPNLRAKIEKLMGLNFIAKGSRQKATNHFNKAANLYEKRGTLAESAYQLNLMGEELQKEGLSFEAFEIFRKANALLEREKEIRERAEVHNRLASLMQKKQTPQYIARQYRKAIGYYGEAGDIAGELQICTDAAKYCYDNDLLEDAYFFALEAKNLAHELKDGITEKAMGNLLKMIISEIKTSDLHA